MKLLVYILSFSVLLSCSKASKLAMDGLNDAVNGRPGKHNQDVYITNSGARNLVFTAMIGSPGSDCQPAIDSKEVTLRPSESETLHVEQVCRGRRRAWWSVELLTDYTVGSMSVYHPEYLDRLVPGSTLVFGNRERNIRIPVTVVAEKSRVQTLPLSQPVVDRAGVAWISKEDFDPRYATRWVLYIAIPKQFDAEKLYVYLDQDAAHVLDIDDAAATNSTELSRTRGFSVGEEALTGGVALNCTEDGCTSSPR